MQYVSRRLTAGLLLVLLATVPGWAESLSLDDIERLEPLAEDAPAALAPAVIAAPGPRRVTPPAAGVSRRITVQIDPEEQALALAVAGWVAKPGARPGDRPRVREVAAVAVPAPSASGTLDWYWDAISPRLGEGAGRFEAALRALEHGPTGSIVPAPRLAHLHRIAERHGAEMLRATVGTRVSPALVLAVISIESAGRVDAVSHKGASGLMQLIPATADRFGVADTTDPTQNIRGGVAYLDWLMGEFGGDPLMVLAAYNAGEGAVRRNGGVPPYAETRAYVPKVLAAWQVARGLCLTPPELVSDGCVFRTGVRG
jgi:hypothetical protein